MKRKICQALYLFIGAHLPKSKNGYNGLFERIRASLVKGFVDSCGAYVNIQPNATIARRIRIGDHSGIGNKCIIQGNVTIGRHVMMGPEVYIYTQNHCFARTDIPMDQQGFAEEKPVFIEDDVWIGSRVTILPGVRIGQGSIVGAAAVVTKDVPPYSVVAGNPAKVVRIREQGQEDPQQTAKNEG